MGALALGSGLTVATALPAFLTGALAVQITRELGFGVGGLGGAIALYRMAGAMTTARLGRLTDRLGAINAIRLAAALSTVAALGIAGQASRWWHLAGLLMVAGVGDAIRQPASNRLIANRVPAHRWGLAFGVKQSAPPAASMLAGLSVPLVAVWFGWRWCFVIAALIAVLVGMAARRPPDATARPARPSGRTVPDRSLVVLLATAFGLGTASSSATTTFYIDSTVAAGTEAGHAGFLFAVASVLTIAIRVVAGAACDRLSRGHLALCGAMLGVGVIGLLLLGSSSPPLMGVGILLALTGTWGFNGITWFALVRAFPRSPGSVTGAINPGALFGATVGPLLFAAAAEAAGYRAAWTGIACIATAGAIAMLAAERAIRPTGQVRMGRPGRPPSPPSSASGREEP